jgi:hypothetical protein
VNGRAAKHASASNEHYTPEPIVTAARAALGRIDLDPASCAFANRLVQAKRYYNKRTNGLRRSWYGRVFLNPPGGKLLVPLPTRSGVVTASSQLYWWDYLVGEYEACRVSQAIFLAFNLDLLQTAQRIPGLQHPTDFPRCYPKERIRFDTRSGTKRRSGAQPTHANMVVFLPPLSGAFHFVDAFREIGVTLL